MPELYLDHITNLSAKETNGVVRTLTRKARIKFTQGERGDSFDVVGKALDVLDAAGVTPFSSLSPVGDETQRYGAMVLVDRDPGLVDNDPGWVDVILTYRHLMDGNNQNITPFVGPGSGVLFAKGRASIVEKTTNFFYPDGDRSDLSKKTMIVVAHQYPTWEQGLAATCFSPDGTPRVILQGGEITIPFPQANFHIPLTVLTPVPDMIALSLVTGINKFPWRGRPPGTWICSEVQWEVTSPTGRVPPAYAPFPTYKMSFEFQYNNDGWNPTVVFLDHRTGRPPADVEPANWVDINGVFNLYIDPILSIPGIFPSIRPAGIWQVPALPRIDFDEFFVAVLK